MPSTFHLQLEDSLGFSSASLCQQSSWYGTLFVVRPSSVSQLSLKSLYRFLSNFTCWLPWAIHMGEILNFLKKMLFQFFSQFFFPFSLTLTPWSKKFQKRYCYKSQSKFVKLLMNFLLKIEILTIFFSIFVNVGPNGSENFKTLVLQIATKSFKRFLNFLLNGPRKSTFGIFEILKFRTFNDFLKKKKIHNCAIWGNPKP